MEVPETKYRVDSLKVKNLPNYKHTAKTNAKTTFFHQKREIHKGVGHMKWDEGFCLK